VASPCVCSLLGKIGEVEGFGSGGFERVISNSGNTYKLAALISMVVMIMGLWAGCVAPEASPTATLPSLPTPTLPPLPTATPTPTPVPPVTVELSGEVDSAGILLEDVEIVSGDGVATLHLAKGTKVLDASGRLLDSITVSGRRPQAPSNERYLFGLAYDFSPVGARFDPSARLTMTYDLTDLPEGLVDEGMTQVGYFEEAESTWTWLDSTADLDKDCVTAEIDHLGSFIVSLVIWSVPVS
jgi:hypothetical protein